MALAYLCHGSYGQMVGKTMNEEKEVKNVKGYDSIHETAGGTPRPSLLRNYASYFG